ncbi:MAG: phage head closure protein [Mesorhizobium sp.]|nr:phage head closure protein [Mesorhizobium sp.]MCO5163534.1 phage head closure protein [Mesorhizobium sp.]
MRAGNLRHTIDLQRETATVADSGSVITTWSIFASVRAEIVTASADEYLTGYGEAEAGNVVFRIWWRPGLDTADRIMHAGKAYDVKAISEIGFRRFLEIKAVATT